MVNKIGERVNDEDFILIQGWMLSDFNLNGNELIIYAVIYSFSRIEGHTFHGGIQHLIRWTNSSKSSVLRALNSLQEKNLIIKKERLVNGVKFTEFSINKDVLPTLVSKWNYQCQNDTTSVNMAPNNIEIKENNNIIINNNDYLKKSDEVEVINSIKKPVPKHKYGTYGRVHLSLVEYERLTKEFGQAFIDNQIELVDEYIESNNNKNKYTNFNLVIRKSIRENWFNPNARNVTNKPKTNEPDWMAEYVSNFNNGVDDL